MEKKRGFFLIVLGIFLTKFSSAQFLGSFYGGVFDSSLLVYGGIFILFFAVLNFLLGRTIFKENRASRAIIGLILAIFATYGLANSNFNIGSLNFGFDDYNLTGFVPTALTIIFIAGIIGFIYKWGFANVFAVLGLLLIGISYTGLVYEERVFFIGGIIFLAIGLLLKLRRPRWSLPRWKRKGERHLYNSNKPPRIIERERIIYEKRQRSVYDLNQSYNSYKFQIFNPELSPHRKRRILRAMYIIERKLRRLGASVPGQTPQQIENTLRARGQI